MRLEGSSSNDPGYCPLKKSLFLPCDSLSLSLSFQFFPFFFNRTIALRKWPLHRNFVSTLFPFYLLFPRGNFSERRFANSLCETRPGWVRSAKRSRDKWENVRERENGIGESKEAAVQSGCKRSRWQRRLFRVWKEMARKHEREREREKERDRIEE